MDSWTVTIYGLADLKFLIYSNQINANLLLHSSSNGILSKSFKSLRSSCIVIVLGPNLRENGA